MQNTTLQINTDLRILGIKFNFSKAMSIQCFAAVEMISVCCQSQKNDYAEQKNKAAVTVRDHSGAPQRVPDPRQMWWIVIFTRPTLFPRSV